MASNIYYHPTHALFKDLTGKRFGRLVALGVVSQTKDRKYVWKCDCDCGNSAYIPGYCLARGTTSSCGCYGREQVTTHGVSRTKAYRAWKDMLRRCENPNNKFYKDYGGRGICVCSHWHDVRNFMKDMGDPQGNYLLDRIDNDGNYEPKNCRWATPKQSSNNRRDSVYVTFNGKTLTLAQWCDELDLHRCAISYRLTHGWTVNEAFTIPISQRRAR